MNDNWGGFHEQDEVNPNGWNIAPGRIAADYFHFGFGIQLKMSQTELALGATYSTASTDFERPIDFPDPGIEIPANDNPASVSFNRWRFIVGLEIPIFGRKVKIE